MGRVGFYDMADAYAGLDELGGVLAKITTIVDRGIFQSTWGAVWRDSHDDWRCERITFLQLAVGWRFQLDAAGGNGALRL